MAELAQVLVEFIFKIKFDMAWTDKRILHLAASLSNMTENSHNWYFSSLCNIYVVFTEAVFSVRYFSLCIRSPIFIFFLQALPVFRRHYFFPHNFDFRIADRLRCVWDVVWIFNSLTAEHLKYSHPILLSIFSKLFNLILNTSEIPEALDIAI